MIPTEQPRVWSNCVKKQRDGQTYLGDTASHLCAQIRRSREHLIFSIISIHINTANMVVTARYCCSIIWISLTSLKVHS